MLVSPTDKQSPRRYIDQSRREAPAQVWLLISSWPAQLIGTAYLVVIVQCRPMALLSTLDLSTNVPNIKPTCNYPSLEGVMQSLSGTHSGSFAWPLVKAAAFWFLFAQAASIVAPTIDTSPKVFAYVATAGFGVQALGLFLGSVMAYGFSWRIGVIAAVCLAVGLGIFSTLPTIALDHAAGTNWISQKIESAKSATGIVESLPPLGSVPPGDHLGPTAQLIFGKETQDALAEARRYLISIPARSPAYKSAQALLDVVKRRLDEIETRNNVDPGENRPLHVLSVDQTGHGLRVTFRNNSQQSIRNVRYRVSYFRVADGRQIEPDNESLILIDIPPRVTWSFVLNDERLNRGVYGAFQVVSWDLEPAVQ